MNYREIFEANTAKLCDKWDLYLNLYDDIFASRKEFELNIAEIGVQNGGSLELLSKYFLNHKKIVGCDIEVNCKNLSFDDPRIEIIIGDITKENVQQELKIKSNRYDIIIDDGSHNSRDIVVTFFSLFDSLANGGLYVIEDLHCSYWPKWGGGYAKEDSAISILKMMIDVINFEHFCDENYIQREINSLLQRYDSTISQDTIRSIASIKFYNSICVIEKAKIISNKLIGRNIIGSEALVYPELLDYSGKSLRYNPYDYIAKHDFNPTKPLMKKHQTDQFCSVVVIIAYYNGAETIERAVKSVIVQSVAPSEFIVVNDGSCKEDTDFLDSLSKKYGFTVLHKSNGGQGSARNFGVENSYSQYICFLDQDDFYLPYHIEDLLNGIPKRTKNFGWVYADLCVADYEGNIEQGQCVQANGIHPKVSVLNCLRNDMFVLPSASLISRDAFLRVRGFDPQFRGYEDDDLFLRLFRAGYENYFIPKSVTVWCIHGASTSHSITMKRSRLKFVRKLCLTFGNKDAFYFNEGIFKRFYPMVLRDLVTAILQSDPNLIEIKGIYKEFVGICKDHNGFSRFKVFIVESVGHLCSVRVVAYAANHVKKLNLLKRLICKYIC